MTSNDEMDRLAAAKRREEDAAAALRERGNQSQPSQVWSEHPDDQRRISGGLAPTEDAPTTVRKIISIDTVRASNDLVIEWMPVPEWAPAGENPDEYGCYIKTLTGKERADWQEASIVQRGRNVSTNFQQTTVQLVILAACDEAGKRIFGADAVRDLLRKNSKVLERIAERAQELSGIGEEEIKTLEGKSETDPGDD